jgi:Fe-S cluster assembly protein SufD
MSAVSEKTSLLEGYAEFLASRGAADPRLEKLREAGFARFAEKGFPARDDEDWRFTSLAPIERTAFEPARPGAPLRAEQLQPFRIPGTLDLVWVDGYFSPELSAGTAGLPKGAFAGSLARALQEMPELVLAHLGRHAKLQNPFVALSNAFLDDGAFVYLPPGCRIEQPLHLLFLASGGDRPTFNHPRCLIVAGESSQGTVIETYSGFSGDRYFTCAVTEIVGLANSSLDHYRLGQESLDAFHLATLQIALERDASFFTHSISHGGAIVRNDIHAFLGGEGIHCTLNGLYLARARQVVDHHMWIDHAAPHCHSYELFKGILEDESRAVFNGRIHVHKGAQKTDAKQSNRNLLLSDAALCHSNPQLEIFADDVRCTHGSTTGHLDDEAIFYLRSRGIGEDAAKSLLTYAFAGEVLQEIKLDVVRHDVEEFLFTRLPKGDVVRQAT